MSFGGGSRAPQAQTPPEVPGVGLQASTSLNGTPVPVVLGTNRVPGNLIFFNDFKATTTTTSQGGGKGGGGDVSTSTTSYSSSVSYGLCVGPIQSVAQIWKTSSTPLTPPNTGANMEIQSGAADQAPWTYLATAHPDQALGYNGLATFNVANLPLGGTSALPNFTFEVMGHGIVASSSAFNIPPGAKAWTTNYAAPDTSLAPFSTVAGLVRPPNTATNIIFDTSPAWCLAELLTNTTWGVGLSPAMVGDLTAYASWCQAAGLFMSPALTSQKAARDILDDWLKATISDVFWSAGQIKVAPYVDAAVTGTAADGSAITYTPDLTPVMVVDDALFIAGQGDEGPVAMTIADPTDLYNQVVVEYSERANGYNTLPALSQNDAHIEQHGLRPAPSIEADFVTTGDVAHRIADLALARQLGVQASYEWRMRSPGELLEPFDIVALTDAALGLIDFPVRVREVEEEDDSIFHVTAEDVPGLIGPMTERPIPVNAGFVGAGNADPGLVNMPVIFEPQGGLIPTGASLEVWGAVSGASDDWGGAQVWASTDDATYEFIGTITGKARQGVLTAPLAAMTPAANPPTIDSANTLSIDISQSDATLLSVSQTSMLALNTVCYVDGELISYQTAALGAAAGLYDITGLIRGAYSSAIGAHAAGTAFARLDQGVFKYPFIPSRIGQTVYFKFLSFNALGGGLYTLDEVQSFAYTLRGTALADPLPVVSTLGSSYAAGVIRLNWDAVVDTRGRNIDYEIRLGDSAITAMIVGRTPLTDSPILGDGTYWVAAHFKVPNGPDIYSPSWQTVTISDSALVSNVIATYDASDDGWSGVKAGTAVIGTNLSLSPAGDILSTADLRAVNDVRYFGGVVASGSYTIPAGARVVLTAPATCKVLIKLGAIVGLDINAIDILTVADMLQLTDVVGAGLGYKVAITPKINLSQDGVTWSGWQNWVLGSYTAKAFDAKVELATSDGTVAALLSDFTFKVDVPDMIQQNVNVAAPSSGITVAFATPFNGGPDGAAAPSLVIAIHGGSQGDSYVLGGRSLTGFAIQFFNGGSSVARNFDWVAQGY